MWIRIRNDGTTKGLSIAAIVFVALGLYFGSDFVVGIGAALGAIMLIRSSLLVYGCGWVVFWIAVVVVLSLWLGYK